MRFRSERRSHRRAHLRSVVHPASQHDARGVLPESRVARRASVLPLSLLVEVHRAARSRLRQAMDSGVALRCRSESARRSGLVRPHPRGDMRGLDGPELRAPNDVAVWPAEGANPVETRLQERLLRFAVPLGRRCRDQHERADRGRDRWTAGLFDSCGRVRHHPGRHAPLPLSAQRERRACCTWRRRSTSTHARSRTALRSDAGGRTPAAEFVKGFVRPRGLDVAATPLLADAIEELGRLPARGAYASRWVADPADGLCIRSRSG